MHLLIPIHTEPIDCLLVYWNAMWDVAEYTDRLTLHIESVQKSLDSLRRINIMANSVTQEYMQIPAVTRAYTTACVLTTAAVVSNHCVTFLNN